MAASSPARIWHRPFASAACGEAAHGQALGLQVGVHESILPEPGRAAQRHLGSGRPGAGSRPIPDHWPRICGIDFGFTHPFAIAWFAIDRDTDTAYLYHAYRSSGETPTQHFAPYRDQGTWMPVAWPHDAPLLDHPARAPRE